MLSIYLMCAYYILKKLKKLKKDTLKNKPNRLSSCLSTWLARRLTPSESRSTKLKVTLSEAF